MYSGYRTLSIEESERKLQDLDNVLIHPEYKKGFENFGDRVLNDLTLNESAFGVAIIRLKEPLKMDENTNSVCIPSTSVNVSTNQYAMNGRADIIGSFLISTRTTTENPLLRNITDPQVRQTFQRMTFADKRIPNVNPLTKVDCMVMNDNPLA